MDSTIIRAISYFRIQVQIHTELYNVEIIMRWYRIAGPLQMRGQQSHYKVTLISAQTEFKMGMW